MLKEISDKISYHPIGLKLIKNIKSSYVEENYENSKIESALEKLSDLNDEIGNFIFTNIIKCLIYNAEKYINDNIYVNKNIYENIYKNIYEINNLFDSTQITLNEYDLLKNAAKVTDDIHQGYMVDPGGVLPPPGAALLSPGAALPPPGAALSPPGGALSPPGGALSPPSGALSPPSGALSPPGGALSPHGGYMVNQSRNNKCQEGYPLKTSPVIYPLGAISYLPSINPSTPGGKILGLAVVKRWFLDNFENPYPDKDSKDMLMRMSGLTAQQLKDWFTNARKRVWHPTAVALGMVPQGDPPRGRRVKRRRIQELTPQGAYNSSHFLNKT
eukprot:GHVL01000737.1.p1 GENE.GHVL01000737.1~~GHVL01000737.1.p1  ORF type:complete len:330 (+),score=117.57 GHVL01000737.1:38-1027(+)